MSRNGSIFHELELSDYLNYHKGEAKDRVNKIPENQFNQASDEELIEHVHSHHEIQPLELYLDQQTLSHEKVEIHASNMGSEHLAYLSRNRTFKGIRFTVHVPFSGNTELWKCRPSKNRLHVPFHELVVGSKPGIGRHLNFVIEEVTDEQTKSKFESKLKERIDRVVTQLGHIRTEVEEYNGQLKSVIQQSIQKRRNEINQYAKIVQSIEIPLQRNVNAPAVERVPLVPKQIKPLPAAKNSAPEYTISDSDYEYILKVIRHEGRTYEALRKTFRQFGEESLRDILLAHLNGHFEGQANAEAFRGEGKTDILIPFENRAAFVGECKIWSGQKKVIPTLDQLLSYTTWRDVKVALLFFNKKIMQFSGIRDALPLALKEHPNFLRVEQNTSAGEWRFVFRSLNDPNWHITVHVFLFDVYVKEENDADGLKDIANHSPDIT